MCELVSFLMTWHMLESSAWEEENSVKKNASIILACTPVYGDILLIHDMSCEGNLPMQSGATLGEVALD